jgi:NADH-quinone oxidoreductase subunit F
MASCGLAAGAGEIEKTLRTLLKKKKYKNIELLETGCIGMCFAEPLIEIINEENESTFFGNIALEDVGKLVDVYLAGISIKEKNQKSPKSSEIDLKLFKQQKRIVLENCGKINPESIEDYLDMKGYSALQKVISTMTPAQVIAEITASGLRGRGGAGFPTGKKWELAQHENSQKKYVICNADEGDPGAFMDRSVLESDPHKVIEGILICAFAIGADEGFIYCRAEYPLAVKRLNKAIKDARKYGFLGKNILNSKFDFTLHLKEGAGAFVCGEETALIASIEGKRGMPVFRPPYPAQKGLWGKPTNINNVETFANISWIIRMGAKKFRESGTKTSPGTKVFALAGKVRKSGLIEVPMGISLRDIIFRIGGGIKDNHKFKGVQLGGPSGGCLPEELLDTPVDYDAIIKTGAIMGSGGMVVMDDFTCMVDVAKYFLNFTQNESCGKCTFCRIGTKRMLDLLEKITSGNGETEDLEKLEKLAENIIKSSLCGLGQTAPNPILTTLKYFKEEYLAHIIEKKCPAGVCEKLLVYEIIAEKCTGCTLCARKCPASAIRGKAKEVHIIDQNKCQKCNVCFEVCRFSAISKS